MNRPHPLGAGVDPEETRRQLEQAIRRSPSTHLTLPEHSPRPPLSTPLEFSLTTPFPDVPTLTRQVSEEHVETSEFRRLRPNTVEEEEFEQAIDTTLSPELPFQTSTVPHTPIVVTPTPLPPPLPRMVNNVTYGNTTYNLNDPQECASYIRVLQTDNAQLAQQAPIQLTRDQFQAYAVQAVNAVLPQPNQRGDPSTVVNPVTTAKTGNRTYYEYEAPPAGWDKDAKEEAIEPWNGTKIDVTPFLNRVQSIIIQRPRALAYTFQKILFVLRHLKGNSNELFRNGALFHPSQPNDYDTYRDYMIKYQTALDEERSFQQLSRGYQGNYQPRNSYNSHPSSKFQLGPGQQPMDLSVVTQQKVQQLRAAKQALEIQELEEEINAIKQKKKGKPHTRSNPPPNRKPPQQSSSNQRRPPPPTQRLSEAERDRRARLRYCFKCAQAGHFARNCPNAFINNLQDAEHKICQLDQLLNDALQFQDEGDDNGGEQEQDDWNYEQPLEDNEFIPDDLQSQVNETDYLDTNTRDLIDLADAQPTGF